MRKSILAVLALTTLTMTQANANMFHVWNNVSTSDGAVTLETDSKKPIYGIKVMSFASGKTYIGTALSGTGVAKKLKEATLEHCQSESGTYNIKVKIHESKEDKAKVKRNVSLIGGETISGFYKAKTKAAVFSCVE